MIDRHGLIVVLAGFALMSLAGCKAIIGDECVTSLDCSEDGDRVCDPTFPNGYCTILDCDPNSCPTEAVCVQFFEGVHSRNYCMRQCKQNADCDRMLYECVESEEGFSLIIDNESSAYSGYCAPKTD
jgi:hypothetical protein